jgi:ureidoglycolate hydrolase
LKFNKERTAIRGDLEGLEQYETAFRSGALRKVVIHPSPLRHVIGVWEKIPLASFAWKERASTEPLEVVAMRIRPRALIIDELTRHPNTDQVFIPVTAGFLAVAGASSTTDLSNPDPASLDVISVAPGEAINIKAGTWHTLPFAILDELVCLSVMRLESLDTYHDLRDLTAAGWVAMPAWRDPEQIH